MAESWEPVVPTTRIPPYDWDLWLARPFRAWVLTQGIDFAGTPLRMQKTIQDTASRRGFKAVASTRDPANASRVWFCGYEAADPKPIPWQSAYNITGENAGLADSYICAHCGLTRSVIPWFAHYTADGLEQIVLECIDETIAGYTALHSGLDLPVADKLGIPIEWKWAKETGPVRR